MVYGDYVTKQKKYISTTTIHMTTKLGNGVTYHEETHEEVKQALESGDLSRSREKLKPLYLHYYNLYDRKTWQDGDST